MLTIQKLVVLLDEFHLKEFVQNLDSSNSLLPKKLVLEIAKHGDNQPETEDLCKLIYGKSDEKSKKNFFQLAHHTLKLTFYLARNYPNYLAHNLSKIERYINNGKKEEANKLAEILLDVSEKIEDRTTQISVLKYFAQSSFHSEQKNHTIKYHQKISKVLENEAILNELYTYLRENLNFKNKSNFSQKTLNPHIAFFSKHTNHHDFSIRFTARYARCFTLTFMQDEQFFSHDNYQELVDLENELEKNAFVVFPYLEDVLFKIFSIKLEYMFHGLEPGKMMEETLRIIKNADNVLFWKNFINVPELFALAVQTSFYVSKHLDVYRENFHETLPVEIKEKISFLRKRCEELLSKPFWEEGYYVKYVNLKSLYCALLLLGDKNDIKNSAKMIEEMLIAYQQISFQKFLDSIFASLILGYFALKDYEAVSDSFKRYKKLTSDNITNEENDCTICGFYYMSQWLSSGKNQYKEKFSANLERTEKNNNLTNTRQALLELADYYEMELA